MFFYSRTQKDVAEISVNLDADLKTI